MEYSKEFIAVYYFIIIFMSIPALQLLYGMYISKKYKSAMDGGFVRYISMIVWVLSNCAAMIKLIYVLI